MTQWRFGVLLNVLQQSILAVMEFEPVNAKNRASGQWNY